MSQKNYNPLNHPAFAIALFIAALSGTALAEPKRQLPGHVPKMVANLQSTGRLPGETQLNLAIGLPLRNTQSLNGLIGSLYDPASPQYGHYLTPEEFTEQFGPTVADYEAVANFAKANGFTITATHSDRMLLEVSAKSADIERAFGLAMRLYPHPTQARSFYAPDTEPSVPSDLPMADISGLSNGDSPHPKNLKRKIHGSLAKNTSEEGSGPNGNFSGSDYRNLYLPGTKLTGTGQSIGLFELDGHYTTDISLYASLAGLTNPPPVNTVLISGFNGVAGQYDAEVALDIEMCMSIAPGLTEIVSFESSTNTAANVILSVMATNKTINQFTCSWDFQTSNPRTTMDSYFTNFIAQGKSFLNASGDNGSYLNNYIPEPDDDPYVTLVGGTTLATSGLGVSWMGEVVWNAPDLASSSGGGISTNYTALPAWQGGGVVTAANGGSTSARNMPDVSMVADNIFIVADDGDSETSGGTSVAVQLFGGFIALVNQQRAAGGHAPIGFVNTNIYPLYTTAAYAADFDDIVQGNNTNGDIPFYFATPGYDLCTGLGAPTGSLLIAMASPDEFFVTPPRGFVATGGVGGPFNGGAQTVTVNNSGTSSLNWSLGGAPSWLEVPSTGGTLAGGAQASFTVNLKPVANTMAQGVYLANLWFTNLTSGQTQVRQFTLQVGQNLIHDGGFECGDFAYWTLTGVDAIYGNFADDGYYLPYDAHSGEWYAALGQTNGYAFISQTFPTVVGQPYLISFWLANPEGENAIPNQFVVNWSTASSTETLYDGGNLTFTAYENFQVFGIATSNSTSLQIGAYNINDYFTLDDVSVTPIPFPNVTSIQPEGQTVNITWNTTAGLSYQVQYATNLNQPEWTNLGTPTLANGTTLSTTEVIGATKQAFYRVVLILSL